jgi:hypothetical protein
MIPEARLVGSKTRAASALEDRRIEQQRHPECDSQQRLQRSRCLLGNRTTLRRLGCFHFYESVCFWVREQRPETHSNQRREGGHLFRGSIGEQWLD